MKIGDHIEGFALEKLVREDAHGQLFVATHEDRRGKLLFRVLHRATLASDDQMRFVVELKLLSKLQHPNLLEIVEAGETPDGFAFYVTEMVEGQTLAERLRAQTLRVPELVSILFDVAIALEAAHQKQLVHGGLTAETILLVGKPGEQPSPKITDFGFARARAHKILDAQADVRAIGMMFAAHPLSPQLDTVMRRARSTDPAERYPTMRALREDLRRVLRGEPLAMKVTPNAPTAAIRILDRTPPPDVVVPAPPRRAKASETETSPDTRSGTSLDTGARAAPNANGAPRVDGKRLAIGFFVMVAAVVGLAFAIYESRRARTPEAAPQSTPLPR